MISSRGRLLTPEIKKLLVSVKLYFDEKKFKPAEPSVKRTADALGIGVATVKRVMADYNRDPKLLEESAKMRGRPVHAVSVSHQEAVRFLRIKSESTSLRTFKLLIIQLFYQYSHRPYDRPFRVCCS